MPLLQSNAKRQQGRPRKIVCDLNRLDQGGYLISGKDGQEIDPMAMTPAEFDGLLAQVVHLPDRVNWPLKDRYLALRFYGGLLKLREKPDFEIDWGK